MIPLDDRKYEMEIVTATDVTEDGFTGLLFDLNRRLYRGMLWIDCGESPQKLGIQIRNPGSDHVWASADVTLVESRRVVVSVCQGPHFVWWVAKALVNETALRFGGVYRLPNRDRSDYGIRGSEGRFDSLADYLSARAVDTKTEESRLRLLQSFWDDCPTEFRKDCPEPVSGRGATT